MFSDCHCHLRDITSEAVEKAEENGFELLLTSGIDLNSSKQALETARKHRIVKACVGIHPWYADEYGEEPRLILRELARDSEVVGISEIGLDYSGRMTKDWVYDEKIIDKAVQVTAFIEQVNLAKELDLPLFVHDRIPDQELLDLLEASGIPEVGASIHGFSKGAEYAMRCVEMGICISIGNRALEGKDVGLMEAIEKTPIEWILTETDSGDPSGILKVAEKIANIKDSTMEEVGQATTINLKRLIRV